MSDDSVLNEDNKSTSLPADVTDDSCVIDYIEIRVATSSNEKSGTLPGLPSLPSPPLPSLPLTPFPSPPFPSPPLP